ncbi:MAG: penicillin-binding protein 2 [Dermatophilaceae bacterium]
MPTDVRTPRRGPAPRAATARAAAPRTTGARTPRTTAGGSGARPSAPRPARSAVPPRPPRRIRVGTPIRRVRGIFLASMFVLTIFAAQMLRVQVFEASPVQLAALNKRLTGKTATPAQRGSIVDSKGVVLATSLERYTVSVNQLAVKEYVRTVDDKRTKVGVVGAAAALAPLLGTTPEALVPELIGTSAYHILAKKVTPLAWRDIGKLGIPGIYAELTYERSYPAGLSAAPVTGAINLDQAPAGGLETMLDTQLAGSPGETQFERSRDGKPIPWADERGYPAVPGVDVTTTVDSDLQWYAENAIANQVTKLGAASGYVVVMEAKTGKVRALASYPTFDPAATKEWTLDGLRNHAVEDVYEPGSTGKVMSVAAAIEEQKVTPTTPIVVPNRIKRSDKQFKDHNEHDTLELTVAGALAKSSNIGVILATESVPAATIDAYYRAFGMGAKTGMGLPGESAGLLTPVAELNGSQRYTMLFGQGYSLTALQAAGVYQTIANKGVRVAPTIVEGTQAPDGPFVPAAAHQGVRVVSESTARQVGEMLEEVVAPGGTAPQVAIPGYRVAGKTGTANRYDESAGRYSGYTTSFLGYAPAEDPEFVVAVTLQRPQVDDPSGSGLAGPVFKDVMAYALQSYRIAPSGTPGPTIPLTAPGASSNPAAILDRKPNG